MTSAPDSESSASGLTRTLMLWFAALAVTWVSGIEPTWRKVHDTAVSFEKVNWHRYEADRKTIALQQSIEVERAALPRLQQFNIDYPNAKARDAARKNLYDTFLKWEAEVKNSEVTSSEASLPHTTAPTEICTSTRANDFPILMGATEAEKNLTRAIDRLRHFCELEKLYYQLSSDEQARRLASQIAIISNGERAQQDSLAEARANATKVRTEADVDFELLGLKFKSAPLLASFLWSGFAFAWLLAAREEVNKSPRSADSANASPPAKQDRNAGVLLVLALLAWAMQLRVSWVGLGITAVQGEMKWKALVAVALCTLLMSSACVVALILTHRADPTDSQNDYPIGRRKFVAGIFLLTAAVFIAVSSAPAAVLKVAQGVMPALPLISLLPLLLVASLWLLRPIASANVPALSQRRILLMGWAGIVAVGLFGGWIMAPARRRKRAAAMKGDPGPIKAGFYRRARPLVVKKRPPVNHYVSEGGWISRKARRPNNWGPIEPPVYGTWLVDDELARNFNAKSKILEAERVALATASWSFEQAALLLLKGHRTGRRNIHRACELLLNGIRHDVMFKRTHTFPRKRSAPSYRLYDLAAGLAVRFNQPRVLQELQYRIQQAGYDLLFTSRLTKWADSNSAWHRRWRERQFPLRWHCDDQVTVF